MQLSKGKVIILYYMRHNINSFSICEKLLINRENKSMCYEDIFISRRRKAQCVPDLSPNPDSCY